MWGNGFGYGANSGGDIGNDNGHSEDVGSGAVISLEGMRYTYTVSFSSPVFGSQYDCSDCERGDSVDGAVGVVVGSGSISTLVGASLLLDMMAVSNVATTSCVVAQAEGSSWVGSTVASLASSGSGMGSPKHKTK
jgi:hypothetical protein